MGEQTIYDKTRHSAGSLEQRTAQNPVAVAKAVIGVVLAASVLTACATADNGAAPEPAVTTEPAIAVPGNGGATASGTVTLVTTNSFAISDEAIAAFEAETGLTLSIVPVGSAGVLANQLVLTRNHPLGDAFFGVDNTFASRLIDNDVAAPFTPANWSENAEILAMAQYGLTPITQGDVCINIDLDWFAAHPDIIPPETFTDLLDPFLSGQTVVLNPTTSSPGMAFLLATISTFGDPELGAEDTEISPNSWQQYWELLLGNDALVVDSWSQAYFSDFSGAGEGGTRPIVVSYASSPAATPNTDGTASTTAALLDTCFLQVEFAGVLNGAANPVGAQRLIEFLSGPQFQSEIPDMMWVYPIDTTAALPDDWAQFTTRAQNPLTMGAEVIEQNRERWLEQWLGLALQ